MNIKMALLLTVLSGFSTLIGYFVVFKKKNLNIIISSLAFASGVMIIISLFDLLKESFNYLNSKFFIIPSILYLLIFIVIGVLISFVLDKVIPNNNKLYKVGVYSFLAILLHNIPEGIITFLTTTNNISLGKHLAIAIALHNIPEGISIAVPIYYATNSKKKAFLYVLISALAEPIGGLIAYMFFNNISNIMLGLILGILVGIMLYIAICELLKESFSYNKRNLTIISFIIGVIIMCLALLI